MSIWSIDEEAKHLEERFATTSQAAFARQYNVPGGPSMVSQHIKGRRPIGLAAATAYARGFKVPLSAISPRLAAEVERARAIGELEEPDRNVEPGPEVRGPGQYPLISWVQAGDWSDQCDNFQPADGEGTVISHHNLGKCGYVLRVSGHSMTAPAGSPHSFPEGILLHVNPDKEPLPGQFVIVRRESAKTATFKRLVSVDGELFLEAINPEWPKRYLALQKGDEFCGVVVDASFGNLP